MAKTLKQRREDDARKRLQQGQAAQPIQPGAEVQPVVQPQGVAPNIEWFDETPDWLKTPAELYGPVGQQTGGNDVITPSPAQTAQQRKQSANGLPQIPQTAAYDPDSNAAYQSAMAALAAAQGNRPVYQDNGYGAQLDSIAAQILNREPFRYDLGSDPMYRMYRDQAMETGRLAMQDTMGRAAALTGGYGSTYAQQLGSQAYDAYLRSLNEQIPALQANARAAYDAEGDRLAQQYSLLANAEDRRYGRYRDEMSDYWQNVSYAKDQANLAYNRGYQQWADAQDQQWQAYNAELAQDQLLYGRSEDSYNRLMQLITNTGYSPSAEELEAAGMSPQEAASWQDYHRIQQELAATKSAGSYSSGSRRSSSGSGTGSDDDTSGDFWDEIFAYGWDETAKARAHMELDKIGSNSDQRKSLKEYYDAIWEQHQNGSGNGTNDVTPITLSPAQQDIVNKWVPIIMQIDNWNDRVAKVDQLYDSNQLGTGVGADDVYEVLLRAVIGQPGYGGGVDPELVKYLDALRRNQSGYTELHGPR